MQSKIFNIYYNWWKNIDKIIFSIIIMLFLLGLFFSFVSTSIIVSDKLGTNSYYFFFKHLVFIIAATFTLLFISMLNQSNLIKFCIFLFLVSIILLLLVPFIGIEVKGSKRWMHLGFLPRFQPIEILKPFMIVSLGVILTLEKIKNSYLKYLLSLLLILPIIFLLSLQPDIGQTLLVIMIWLSLIFISGINLFLFSSFFLIIGIILSYLIFFVPKFEYIKIRVISFMSPSSNNNYQSEKASEAINNGGLFGKGIGEGKLNSKIPEAHTDYIVSVISEEFGAIVVILIMLIYLFFAYKVMKKIDEQNDNKVKFILLGCIFLILIQSFIHIGVNIRILPTTGMTLPFLSYGGSSIISTSIVCGIILNLTRRKINL